MGTLATSPAVDTGAQITQIRDEVTPNLSVFWGVNPPIAAAIAEQSGDTVPARYATLGWMDRTERSFVVMVSGELGEIADVAFISEGLPLSRPILLTLYDITFEHGLAAGVRVLVRPGDQVLQRTLSRLGFRCFRQTDDDRRAFILHPTSIPSWWRRSRLRKAH